MQLPLDLPVIQPLQDNYEVEDAGDEESSCEIVHQELGPVN